MDGHSARVKPNPGSTDRSQCPAILLVEDDAASCCYLSHQFETLGCQVLAHTTGRAALRAAGDGRFDLLVVDRKLPDMDGLQWLAEHRADRHAVSRQTPAVASSAEWTRSTQQAMLDGGFVAVLGKPCAPDDLRHILEAHLDPAALPVRHDGAALLAAGSSDNLAALRRLFERELGTLAGELAALCADRTRLTERLHRLCASAGFCGAPALAAASRRWLLKLRSRDPDGPERAQFEQALQAARDAFSRTA